MSIRESLSLLRFPRTSEVGRIVRIKEIEPSDHENICPVLGYAARNQE